jgi:hypothetical protein
MHSAASNGNSGHLQEITSLLDANTSQVTLPFQPSRLLKGYSGEQAVKIIYLRCNIFDNAF